MAERGANGVVKTAGGLTVVGGLIAILIAMTQPLAQRLDFLEAQIHELRQRSANYARMQAQLEYVAGEIDRIRRWQADYPLQQTRGDAIQDERLKTVERELFEKVP